MPATRRLGARPPSPPTLTISTYRLDTWQVLCNPALWLMGINYFCISMVRTCLSDWSAVFLLEAKGLPLTVSASCLFLMETGGFVGSLVAGTISDQVFGGRRGPVVCLCSSMLAPGLLAIRWATSQTVLQATYAYIGFCAFPVHVLLGLFSREVVPPGVGSSAGGFVKCIAQVGGAFAGLPLGYLQQSSGWDGVLAVLAAMGIVSGIAAAQLWGIVAGEGQKIMARNGSVADFAKMQKVSSMQRMQNLMTGGMGGMGLSKSKLM